jgi:large subunit ribosomal protein L32e
MAAKKDKKAEKVVAEVEKTEKKAAPKKAQKESSKAQETKAKTKAAEAKPVKAEAKPATEEVKVETPAEEVTEKEQKPKFVAFKPRPLPRPVEKSTLDLDDETRRLLDARSTHKSSLPAFNRIDSHKKKKLKLSWRKPMGHHSQMRRQRKAKGSIVKIGFGSPALVRGLHASGYEEVFVYRPADVKDIKKTQAIRIGGTVGRKKQLEIEKVAKELNVKVLNPLNVFEEVQ